MKLNLDIYAESIELVGGNFFTDILKGLRVKKNGRFISGISLDDEIVFKATDYLFKYSNSLEVKNVSTLQKLIDYLKDNTDDPTIDIVGKDVIASFKLFDDIYVRISYEYTINYIEQAPIL